MDNKSNVANSGAEDMEPVPFGGIAYAEYTGVDFMYISIYCVMQEELLHESMPLSSF